MLEADVRDDRHFRRHEVGRIESTSEPHLQGDDIAARVAKRLECEQRRVFEERERRKAPVGSELLDATGRFALRNRPTINTHTLDVSLQVRRSELPRPVTRRPQNGLDHRRDAALAIGPRDVNIPNLTLRMPTVRGGLRHSVQPELDAARLQAVEPLQRFAVSCHPARYSTMRATVLRISWRVEIMSIMPCSRRNSAR